MIQPGLCSITFRQLAPEDIVALVAEAGLAGIEWGGDVHVPHGDTAQAEKVRKLTEDAGLACPSYGSYYRAGHDEPVPFGKVLDTAEALGCRTVRVWAGKQGSEGADDAYRQAVSDDLNRIAELAADKNVVVACEWHANTLTDTLDSGLAILEHRRTENLQTYWQAPVGMDDESCLQQLQVVTPYVRNFHVFQWVQHDRHPLAEGRDRWQRFFAAGDTGRDHWALMEFVANDDPEQFRADAAVLKNLLAG